MVESQIPACMEQAAHCEHRADEMRIAAASMKNPRIKGMLMRTADSYDHMAVLLRRRIGPGADGWDL